jgi:branched-chain amino acid transport system ATP-binding protein
VKPLIKPLVLENVSKWFGGLAAINEVSLEVEPGERRVVIGPNGAGKTTLFNLICGQLHQTSGSIKLFGREVSRLHPFQRAALGLARTFQITSLFRNLTVFENVALAVQASDRARFVMYRLSTSYRGILQRTEGLLKEWNMWERCDDLIGNLSYGDQRLVEIIMALAGHPKLLLLDEPTAGLSVGETQVVTSVIGNLGRDTTVFLIEHDMDVAFQIAESITVLHQGKVLISGPPGEVQKNLTVKEIYLGKESASSVGQPKSDARSVIRAKSPEILSVKDIHVYYGDSYVLQGISLSVVEGQVAVIVGRNGVGKTTLIRSILGFTPPRRGEVVFKGADVTHIPLNRTVRMGMTIVPQGRHIWPSLTVKENMEIAARHVRKNGKAPRWTLESVLELFPRLGERISQRAGKLSGGEQQMLATARALIGNPVLLVMDEPSEGLAPLLVQELYQLYRKLKEEGLSILLVEQNLALTLDVADYVYVMSKGAIAYEATPAEVWGNEDVKTRYLGI